MNTEEKMEFVFGQWRLLVLMALSGLVFATSTATAQESICARVKIEIDQELTLERQGFEARMSINNSGLAPLENLGVVVNFTDEGGQTIVASSNPADTAARFFIKLTSSDALPTAVAGGAEEKIRWLIIPAPGAASENPKGTIYFVGATLTYRLSGQDTKIDVTPDSILVKPMPNLTLDYFLPNEVYGDDPFTTQIEPAIPFSLGVRVKNSGFGVARNLQIDSGQPKIIDNKQGLLVNFNIDSSEVNGQPATRSLLADFGDIQPSRSGVARWVMTSSLYGKFVEFTATFSHGDELGGQLTSLITAVKTHLMVHDVLVDLPGRDNIRDFLALDGDTLRVYESENADTVVQDLSSSSSLSGSGIDYSITVPSSVGFAYAKLVDPKSGSREIGNITRSDGKTINPANAWLSRTYNVSTKNGVILSIFLM